MYMKLRKRLTKNYLYLTMQKNKITLLSFGSVYNAGARLFKF